MRSDLTNSLMKNENYASRKEDASGVGNKDIPHNTVAAGNPLKGTKTIEGEAGPEQPVQTRTKAGAPTHKLGPPQ